jgi:hypothetical protein
MMKNNEKEDDYMYPEYGDTAMEKLKRVGLKYRTSKVLTK